MWITVTVCEVVACLFRMWSDLTLRCVEVPGEPTTSVVVAVVIAVFCRPGVTVVPL